VIDGSKLKIAMETFMEDDTLKKIVSGATAVDLYTKYMSNEVWPPEIAKRSIADRTGRAVYSYREKENTRKLDEARKLVTKGIKIDSDLGNAPSKLETTKKEVENAQEPIHLLWNEQGAHFNALIERTSP
jgi:hypothetical protein